MCWHVQQVGHDCLELVTGVRPTGYLLQIQTDTRESSDKTEEKYNFSRYYLLIEFVETLKYIIEVETVLLCRKIADRLEEAARPRCGACFRRTKTEVKYREIAIDVYGSFPFYLRDFLGLGSRDAVKSRRSQLLSPYRAINAHLSRTSYTVSRSCLCFLSYAQFSTGSGNFYSFIWYL